MKRIAIVALLLSALSSVTIAQDYLVTTKGDTLKGRISIYKNRQGHEQVDIKVNKKKQNIRLVEISLLNRKGESFRTLFAEGQYRLGKIVSEAKFLSEYMYTPTSHDPQRDFSASLLVKENGDHIRVPKALLFRKTVAEFLEDCPEVSSKLLAKGYDRSQMNRIIADYNACLSVESALVTKKESITGLLNDLRELLQKSKKVEGKADIRAMLKDLAGKVEAGEEIPSYLRVALTNALQNDLQLSSLLLDILDRD